MQVKLSERAWLWPPPSRPSDSSFRPRCIQCRAHCFLHSHWTFGVEWNFKFHCNSCWDIAPKLCEISIFNHLLAKWFVSGLRSFSACFETFLKLWFGFMISYCGTIFSPINLLASFPGCFCRKWTVFRWCVSYSMNTGPHIYISAVLGSQLPSLSTFTLCTGHLFPGTLICRMSSYSARPKHLNMFL